MIVCQKWNIVSVLIYGMTKRVFKIHFINQGGRMTREEIINKIALHEVENS